LNTSDWAQILGRIPDKNEQLALDFLAQVAESFHWIQSVALFGSRANGTHTPRSDFDVCVQVVAGTSFHEWNVFTSTVNELSPTLHSVDLLRSDKIPEHLKKSVNEEGIKIYNGPS
jgi:uncharacterized protein